MPTGLRRRSRRSCARSARCSASCRPSRRRTRSSSDFLPWAASDGMEHRNSTILTEPARLRRPGRAARRAQHRRPRVLPQLERRAHPPAIARAVQARRAEPVRRVVVRRRVHELLRAAHHAARRVSGASTTLPARIGHMLDLVIRSPARKYRSAEEVSRFAQFVDAGVVDRPDEHRQHTSSPTTTGARSSASASICRCERAPITR